MKELREILAGKCHNERVTDTAMKEVLDLFLVVKRFRCSWWDEDENTITDYFWAKDKEEVYYKVFDLNPKATYLICDRM
jgi:hypothetical protein